MEKPKSALSSPVKRKRKAVTNVSTSEPKAAKVTALSPSKNIEKDKKLEKKKKGKKSAKVEKKGDIDNTPEDVTRKFPILKNEELINKFLKVPLNNNQKGRIRQALMLKYQGMASELLPEVLHSQIQAILQSSDNLTDSDLRRIRILYNMLKTALKTGKIGNDEIKKKEIKMKKTAGDQKDIEKDSKDVKKKGPKRYVVFLGNLPLDVNKDKIMNHFVEMNEQIVDIRIPKVPDGKKSAIAYVELANEPSYELALSKHHSMLGSKRINVLYSLQKKSKISKAEAKSKSAKLIALKKSGKLIGSIPLAKKRSQRRLKMKKAKAKEAQE